MLLPYFIYFFFISNIALSSSCAKIVEMDFIIKTSVGRLHLKNCHMVDGYVYRGSSSALFTFVSLLSGVNSKRKELALLGVKSSYKSIAPLGRATSCKEAKH